MALLLFVTAAVCRNQARMSGRLADAHLRLATLQDDTGNDFDGAMSIWNRVTVPGFRSIASDVRRHRATASYWSGRFDELGEVKDAAASQNAGDPEVQLLAANASFRASAPEAGDRAATVERLDAVIQAYAEVLRRDPALLDAAYNYEFVSRVRDGVARGAASRTAGGRSRPSADTASIALPPGATIHGRIGALAADPNKSDFKTIAPLSGEEREQQEAGQGKVFKRKG